jgi:uncharacterized protein YecT (DUF1311 family)
LPKLKNGEAIIPLSPDGQALLLEAEKPVGDMVVDPKLVFVTTIASTIMHRSPATAQSVDQILADIRRQCVEDRGTVPGVGLCEREKEKEYGAELEKAYKQTLSLAGKHAILLRAFQQNWLMYQKSTCEFYEKRFAYEGEGIARAAAATCLLRTTLERLEELKVLADN